MKKKIFITGAAGFIGRHLIKEFESRGISCSGIDNIAVPELNIESCSLLEEEKLEKIISSYAPDAIVHLAAIALATYKNAEEIYKVNVCGTESLLNIISRTRPEGTRVVLVSTAGVYGNQNRDFYDESLPFNPENHYSYSKMITEFISNHYENLDIKIVRPFNIIGVGQKSVFLIPKLVEHFALKKPELRIGNLKPERDYIDISYCVYILAEMALREEIKHRIYNICSGEGHSVQNVIDVLSEYCDFSPKIIVDQKFVRKNEVWRMVGDSTRLEEFLGGKTDTNFEETLKTMCRYYAEK